MNHSLAATVAVTRSLLPALLALPLLANMLAAAAQPAQPGKTIYRCAGGAYSDQPCTDGKPVVVDDSRTAAQQAQAREAAKRDAALAERQAAERRAQEAAAQKRTAPMAGIGQKPVPPPHAAASAAKHHKHKQTAEQRAQDQAKRDAKKAGARAKRGADGSMGQY
jgi:hypothetical protein